MNVNGASDLARMQTLQRQAFATRTALDRAATELTTGQKASRYEATGGNLTRLFALERALDRNKVFQDNARLTELRLDVTQEALGRILKPTEALAIDLSTAVGLGDLGVARMHASAARRVFADTLATLNTQVAGQSLFAGTATDRPALAASDAILAEVDALVAGAADAAGAIAAVEEYFRAEPAPAGAFFSNGYLGAADDLTPVEIGEGVRLDYGLRANAEPLVAVLRAQAMAAAVTPASFGGDVAFQMTVLAEAGRQMIGAKEGMLDLRAAVGLSQNAVERAQAERVSERDTLSLARARIVAVDPLEAASNYQSLEVQLESIFTVTSRLANLRFTNFLR